MTPGVAMASFAVRANGTDLIPVTAYFPATEDGAPSGAALPALVYLQGGAVDPARYGWQGVELARRGVVVVMPRHPLDLAFFGIDFGARAREGLLSSALLGPAVDGARVAVAGHSLGGVVAMKLAIQGGFQAAVVQASFSDPADDAKVKALTLPTLYLAAANDCQARAAQVREGWAKLPSPTALVMLEGATHFQFTDSDAKDAERGCPGSTSLDDAHARIVAAMDGFLRAALGLAPSVGAAALQAIPGAQVEVR